MTDKDTLKSFRKYLAAMSDEQLIGAFNREVGNNGWTGERALYLFSLREEFERRGYDYSSVGDSGGMSYKKKVTLEGKKVVLVE